MKDEYSGPEKGTWDPKTGYSKTLDEFFADWYGETFPCGYGSGEPHILPALKRFFELCRRDGDKKRGFTSPSYDHREIEAELGAAVAWLIIGPLCRNDTIECCSPRFAWLSPIGCRVQEYVAARTVERLIQVTTIHHGEQFECYRDTCNCGPEGHVEGKLCANPFWRR